MKNYTITGVVWGNLWGGGKGGYASEKLTGDNKEYLINKARRMLKDGSLDSGMGYESLYGAYLTVKTKDIKIINGKEYINTSYDDLIIGKLSDDEVGASYDYGF